MTPLRVRIAFDLICPWCFIGEQRFARVVSERVDVYPIVERMPYLLHPDLRGSVPRDELLTRKFGSKRVVQDATDRIEKIGSEVGIRFDFDAMQLIPDTVPAHALVKWAADAGVGAHVIARIYRAYFCEGRDIGRVPVLVDVARAAGMDADDVRKRLLAEQDFAAVRTAAATVRRAGITGVPFFIFGERLAVQGAQDEATFARIIDRATGSTPIQLPAAASWN
jgi:predicted DsbA family dithiol-disulfide isomerase